MECMHSWTGPQLYSYSKEQGIESEPWLAPTEKFLQPDCCGEGQTYNAASCSMASPAHHLLNCSCPWGQSDMQHLDGDDEWKWAKVGARRMELLFMLIKIHLSV